MNDQLNCIYVRIIIIAEWLELLLNNNSVLVSGVRKLVRVEFLFTVQKESHPFRALVTKSQIRKKQRKKD